MRSRATAAALSGTLVRVDGGGIYTWRCGEGTPTVVLVAGAGVLSLNWIPIVDAIAELTSVLTYDRPGYGWSTPSRTPRTAERAGRELEQLLDAAGVTPPFILVGHSIGGLYVRAYARRRPETVAGIVLVDSSHERQVELMPPELTRKMQQLQAMASSRWKVQLLRPLIPLVALLRLLPKKGMSWPARRALFKQQASLSLFRAGVAEAGGMSSSASSPPGPLPPVPLVVLVAGRASSGPPRVSAEVKARVRTMWLELQEELATMSPRSTHVIVEGAGHMIPDDKPQVVIDAVRSLVDEWRRDEHAGQGDAAGLA